MAIIRLDKMEDTGRLGQIFARTLQRAPYPAIFLSGPLGCGKTTLTGYIVKNLPGGERAEVSSPSFTICNVYPTLPRLLHCDLYRCKGDFPDDILETMDSGEELLILEWSDFLNINDRPKEYLDIKFKMDKNARLLKLDSHGPSSSLLAAAILSAWRQG